MRVNNGCDAVVLADDKGEKKTSRAVPPKRVK